MATRQQQTKVQFDPHEFAPPMTPAEMWPNAIDGEITANEVKIGVGVRIESGVQIIADKVVLGDFTYVGRNSRIIVPEIEIGEYTRVNELAFLGGTKPMKIGRGCYFGRGVQLDSTGGLTIGNYVGVGSLSQIWTHIRHGDTVQGCQYDFEYPLVIEDDVWLVARVTVGGVRCIGARTIVFNESNLSVKHVESDGVYAGNIAEPTARFKPQFAPISMGEKLQRLTTMIEKFVARKPLYRGMLQPCMFTRNFGDDPDVTYFSVTERVYTKRYSRAEVEFLRDRDTLAKFAPMGE